MQRLIFIPLILFLSVLIFSCEDEHEPSGAKMKEIELAPSAKHLIDSDNQFGLDLFRMITIQQEENKNTMISPVSISLALAMTYNGAVGSTKEAMEETLGLQGLTTKEINQSYQELMEALVSVDSKVTLEIANSIWYRESYEVRQEFIDVNRKYYNAEVSGLDFNNSGASETINQWVSNHTRGKISEIIQYIPSNALMYLVNALYFNGKWKYQFDPDETSGKPFYLEDGAQKQVDMMHIENAFKYHRGDHFRALEMPYGRGNFSMVCLLPDANYGIENLIAGLSQETWNNMVNGFSKKNVELEFPRFKFDYKKKLKEMLCQLGMEVVFTDQADFSSINPNGGLCISDVVHKTYLEVDEKGTEAAAVTVVEMVNTTSAGNMIRFNRPFVFAIREISTNTIIFIGKFADPSN